MPERSIAARTQPRSGVASLGCLNRCGGATIEATSSTVSPATIAAATHDQNPAGQRTRDHMVGGQIRCHPTDAPILEEGMAPGLSVDRRLR
jgi:hypothetical protein